MPETFSFPGLLTDAPALQSAWSAEVAEIVDAQVRQASQFFSPLGADSIDTVEHDMDWGAFPKKLARLVGAQRLRQGEDRDQQEEYCEWSGTWDESGTLIRACFTTETPNYYRFLATHDSAALHAAYEASVGGTIDPTDLLDSNGAYDPRNALNRSHAVHMVQQFNTLSAAIILAAQSSVVRTDENGEVITNTGQLIDCGISADEDRNSDPLIVTDVNNLARQGARISLRDPIGLYLQGPTFEGWTVPENFDDDPATFWTVTRGASGFGMHAVYETPEAWNYQIGEIKINGTPLTSPSQIADHVVVRLTGIAKDLGTAEPVPSACGDQASGLESLEDAQAFPMRA